MTKRTLAFLMLTTLTALSLPAAAQAPARGPIGVGVERSLGGAQGAALVYDAGLFHISALLGFLVIDRDPAEDETLLSLAGRFFFHVHRTDRADFGIGGGIGVVMDDQGPVDETNIQVELGAQIRAFITDNVAIHGGLGVIFVRADNALLTPETAGGAAEGAFGLNGQLSGSYGLVYYF